MKLNRREVYATTGPRIAVRVADCSWGFSGWLNASLQSVHSFRGSPYAIDAAKWPKLSELVEREKTHSAMTPLLEGEAAAFGG